MINKKTFDTVNWTQTNYSVTVEDYRKIDINLATDITGKEIEMTIRKDFGTAIILAKTATIINALVWTAEIIINKADLPTPINDYASLTPWSYLYDIQLKTTATNWERETFQFGVIQILNHVTQN